MKCSREWAKKLSMKFGSVAVVRGTPLCTRPVIQPETGNKSEKYGSKRDHEVRAEQEIEWKKSKAVGKRKSVR